MESVAYVQSTCESDNKRIESIFIAWKLAWDHLIRQMGLGRNLLELPHRTLTLPATIPHTKLKFFALSQDHSMKFWWTWSVRDLKSAVEAVDDKHAISRHHI